MPNKKTIVIIVSVLAFFIFSATIVFAATNSLGDTVRGFTWKEIGRMVDTARNDENKNDVVAIINGEPITKEQVLMKKYELSLSNKNISIEDVQEAVTFDVVLVQVAKEQDLYPMDEEALEYVDVLRGIYEEGLREVPNNEYLRGMSDYIKALGLSEREYWENDSVVNSYRNLLAIGKLREKMAIEWGYTEDKLVTTQQIDEFMSTFEGFINHYVSQAKVTITDSSAF